MKGKWKFVAIPSLYATLVVAFIGGIIYFQQNVKDNAIDPRPVIQEQVDVQPVIKEEPKLKKPYVDQTVKEVRGYYNYQGNNTSQEKSLVYYDKTYLQNMGIDYSNGKVFAVMAIYDGIVTDIKDDPVLGKTIIIRHNDKLRSVYQSLENIKLKLNDNVKQGQVIADSGTSKINQELKNHLHFEMNYNGQTVDPNQFFNKKITEI